MDASELNPWDEVPISVLEGKTLRAIERAEGRPLHFVYRDTEYLRFTFDEGVAYMLHHQDCCECVTVKDMSGHERLEGGKVLSATERTEDGETELGTCTATFYSLQTMHDDVAIEWFGESNGYYSESVSVYWIPNSEEE